MSNFRKPAVYRPDDLGQGAWNADVVRALRELQELPILRGHLVEDLTIGVTSTDIQHGLGRVPVGFWVVNKLDQADVWQPAAHSKDILYLQASSPVLVDIWVF